jgi:hypothetical protein
LTLWSLTRLISSSSRVLLIWFFVFPGNVFGPAEIFRDRIVSVAVPAKELFFTWGPGEVFVSSRAPRRVIDKGCLFLLSCHCPSYFLEDSLWCFFCRFLADSRVQNGRGTWQEKNGPSNGALCHLALGHHVQGDKHLLMFLTQRAFEIASLIRFRSCSGI